MAKQIKCPNCTYEGAGKTYTPGSVFMELFLWLLLLVPGLIYSIWRLTARYFGCPLCGFKYVIK